MIRTMDAITPYNSTGGFTTARSFAHIVGGGANRRIFVIIVTEDFSTGLGEQTPTSVTYGGNVLILENIVKYASIQTAAIYSGLDSVCGAAGSHNVVVTYAAHVDAIGIWAVSGDNFAQVIREALGSTVASGGSSATTNITTLTDKAFILAVIGQDEGTAGSSGTVTTNWNIGTEPAEIANASVGGSMVYYERPTAGNQDMIATLSETVTRLCALSVAFETINTVNPSMTPVAEQTGQFNDQKSVAVALITGTEDVARCDVSTDGPAVLTLIPSGAASITDNGTQAPYVTGSNADVVATLANGIKFDRDDFWEDPDVPPLFSDTETITILITDAIGGTGGGEFNLVWELEHGNGTLAQLLSNPTVEGMNDEIHLAFFEPEEDFIGETRLYVEIEDGNGNIDWTILPIVVSEPSPIVYAPSTYDVTLGILTFILGVGIVDFNENIVTVRVQCTGGVVDVSPVGSVEVSAGAKLSNSFTLSGVQSELNLTIGSLLYLADSPGSHTIEITATDGTGLVDSKTVIVDVTVPLPQGVISNPIGSQYIPVGTTMRFVTTTDDPTLSFLWSFGLGSGIPDTSGYDTGDVVFNVAGVFYVTLTAVDIFGQEDPTPATLQIAVFAPPSETRRGYVVDLGNMQMRYVFEFLLSQYQYAIMTQSKALPHGAGVSLSLLTLELPVFGFEEAGFTTAAPFGQAPFISETAIINID